ncbi:nectin-1-like isoform X1 [Hemiscyllium ocellatum]|uniref:nectin-1-like isoform X1 n=1 Tax=Hemiscyllium ocellatum TaxID=170820 RepID=UPI002966D2BF|nr:nectin-1-like isoform X1 [Hemiscyllium ocellatum]
MATLYLIPFVLLLQTWSVCDAQNVKVEPFIYGYVGNQAVLRCQFVDPDNSLQVTQITWMKNPTTTKVNLAVYNPDFGVNYPTDTGGRIHFRQVTNMDATLIIDRLEMEDDGIYSCEFATYPDGNQDATTNLTILAKPENSGKTILVQAGHAEVPVARCVSANGKPPATISWSGGSEGNVSETITKNSDGTFTVTSEYLMIPTGDNNGEKLTCVVMQQALDRPVTIPIELSVQYAPIVSIEGYDENWYLNREHASLTCSAKANPQALTYKWLLNGEPLPSSIHVDGHQLTVQDVSYVVNGTFTCEVTNTMGTGRAKMDVVVREKRLPQASNVGAIVGGVIGGILALLLIAGLVAYFLHKRQRGAAGSYETKKRVFGTGNGAPQPEYTYRPDSDSERVPSGTVTTSSTVVGHHTGEAEKLLTSEAPDYENFKSSQEEEDNDDEELGSSKGPALSLPGHPRDEIQMEDDMESQRDGSIISKRAVYV